MRWPSALVTMVGCPPSIAATAELVVPRSIPTTFSALGRTAPSTARPPRRGSRAPPFPRPPARAPAAFILPRVAPPCPERECLRLHLALVCGRPPPHTPPHGAEEGEGEGGAGFLRFDRELGDVGPGTRIISLQSPPLPRAWPPFFAAAPSTPPAPPPHTHKGGNFRERPKRGSPRGGFPAEGVPWGGCVSCKMRAQLPGTQLPGSGPPHPPHRGAVSPIRARNRMSLAAPPGTSRPA